MRPSKKEAMHAGKTKHALIAYALVSAVFALLIGQPSRSAAAEVVVTEEAFAQMFEYDNWDNEIQIRKYVGKDTDVVIPAFVGEYPVTQIQMEAFSFCDTLRSIIMPDSVTYIGESAFEGCSGLKRIVMSNSVVRIGSYAFAGCDSLTTFDLPNSLQYLGSGCFYGCGGLTYIEVPGGVKVINENTFCNCINLKTVTLPGSLRQLAVTAFSGCYALTVTAPPDSKTIRIAEEYGLQTEAKASDAKVQPAPAAPISDFSYEFEDDGVVLTGYRGSETSILLPDRVEGKPVVGIRNGSTNSEEGLQTSAGWSTPFFIEIPEGVTRIEDETFASNIGLCSVILPDSLTYIGEGALSACCSLTSLVIPGGVTDIGAHAFAGTEIYDITIPGGVEYPGEYLLVENMRLRHAVFQEGVQSIPANTFYCFALESVQIPDSVTSIGSEAFLSCYSLHTITIPGSVTDIGEAVFDGCSEDLIVHCRSGSAMEVYAKMYGVRCEIF